MKIPFREYHLLELLQQFEKQRLPLDLFLSDYLRAHKAIGSKDRQYIAETVYGLIRWKGLLEYMTQSVSWKKLLDFYLGKQFEIAREDQNIPIHIRVSFPKILFDLIAASYGQEEAVKICTISNTPAPTTIRVNILKISRDALLKKWQKEFNVIPSHSPAGITFLKKINFFSLEEFKNGLFEIQDDNSQLLANLVEPAPGDLVIDYCSGSGGKSLAFAHKLQNKGQIFLHDVRPYVLQMAKKRLKRAGVQNAQIILADDPKLQKLKKKMNWVLVDAPCTGTGTLRRNPDMKWRFTESTLKTLVSEQRVIFEKALSFMAPEGRIVYATCSILREENENQINHFMKTYQLELAAPIFHTLPKINGGDGFFGAILKKTKQTSFENGSIRKIDDC